jgi:hypothetical protein
MKIKAVGTTIVEWDPAQSRMVIINPGESDELSDTLAQQHVDGGRATAVGAKSEARAAAPKPAKTKGSKAAKNPALAAARANYKAAFGKNPSPRFTVDQINARIAEGSPSQTANSDDAPPAE